MTDSEYNIRVLDRYRNFKRRDLKEGNKLILTLKEFKYYLHLFDHKKMLEERIKEKALPRVRNHTQRVNIELKHKDKNIELSNLMLVHKSISYHVNELVIRECINKFKEENK